MLISRWLRKIFARRPAVSTEPFPLLDKEYVRRETLLQEAARSDGGNDLPDSRALSESATEINIKNIFERQLEKYIDTLNSERHEYAMRLNSIFDTWRVNVVEGEETALVDNVVSDGKKDIGPIEASANSLKHRADELGAFRAKHDLLHRLPDCHDYWRAILLLLIFFILEWFVTVVLLRESGGMIMVITVSIVYCALNCVFPFFLAQYARAVNYPSRLLFSKLRGLAILLLILGLGIVLNLLMGHYRSAALELATVDYSALDIETLAILRDQVNDASASALRNFLDSPLGIVDTLSWFLAAAGLIAFIFSFLEGLLKDDVYPGYGALYRKFDEQLKSYDDDVDELIDSLKSRREQGVSSIESRKRQLVEDLGRIPHLNRQIQMLDTKFDSAYGALNNDFAELMHEYRRENRSFRTSPEPPYFNRPVRLREYRPEKLNLYREPTEEQAKIMLDKLSHFSNRLHEEFKVLTARVRPSNEILRVDPLQISAGAD